MNIVEQLTLQGVDKGLCSDFQNKIKNSKMSIRYLAKLMKQGIDFCVMYDYPTLEMLRSNFRGKADEYGIFIDGTAHEKNKDIILNGESKAFLHYDGYTVNSVYVRHDSQASICVSENASVRIDVFDNSYVAISKHGEHSEVSVSVYGTDAKIDLIGEGIKVDYITDKKHY